MIFLAFFVIYFTISWYGNKKSDEAKDDLLNTQRAMIELQKKQIHNLKTLLDETRKQKKASDFEQRLQAN